MSLNPTGVGYAMGAVGIAAPTVIGIVPPVNGRTDLAGDRARRRAHWLKLTGPILAVALVTGVGAYAVASASETSRAEVNGPGPSPSPPFAQGTPRTR